MLDTKEKLLDIRKKLGGRLLLGDGAAGMLLTDSGVDQPYNRASITHAPVVQAVHEECLPEEAKDVFVEQAEALLEGEAGALLLETFRTSPSSSRRNQLKGGTHCPR